MSASQKLAAVFRDTLRRVELSADLNPNDSSLPDLKRSLALMIAALEVKAAQAEEHKYT
jgi:hypothetical protein